MNKYKNVRLHKIGIYLAGNRYRVIWYKRGDVALMGGTITYKLRVSVHPYALIIIFGRFCFSIIAIPV